MTSLLAVLVAIGLCFASAVDAEQIYNFAVQRNSRCRVYDVFVDPCPQALEDRMCELSQGLNATIRFKYMSEFSTRIPKTRLFAQTSTVEFPIWSMELDACQYTECPMIAKMERSWSYQLYISEYYPINRYTIKLKYWNDEDNASNADVCIFTFGLKIVL